MEHIVIDEEVCRGKPVIEGTRITVEFILELLANGWSTDGIIENYPQLKEEDIFHLPMLKFPYNSLYPAHFVITHYFLATSLANPLLFLFPNSCIFFKTAL